MDFRIVVRALTPKRLVASTMLVAALSATAVPAATPSAAQQQADDPVVATVNDIAIHESDIRAVDREMGRNLTMQGTRREEIVKLLIDSIVVSAAASNTALDEAEIRARTAFVRNRAIMEQAIAIAGRKAANEQALRKAYDEMVARITIEPEYHLYELYFPVADRDDETAKSAVEAKARKAYERIAKGEAFEAVVREMSDSSSAKANGGNRGYVTRAMMGKELSEAAATLDRGKISKPIKTQAGWHLIKIEETRMRTPPDLETVRGALEAEITRQAQADFVDKLRSEAKIKRLDNVSIGNGAAVAK